VVMCLGQGADLHMAQLMPLPLIISCPVNPDWFYLPGFIFCRRLTWVVPDRIQEGHKTVVCVCVGVCVSARACASVRMTKFDSGER